MNAAGVLTQVNDISNFEPARWRDFLTWLNARAPHARSRPIFSAGFPGAERPHHSRPEIAICLAVVMLAFAFPFLPWARDFGFETRAPRFYAVVAVLVAVYLLVVEAVKRLFYRPMSAARGAPFPARA